MTTPEYGDLPVVLRVKRCVSPDTAEYELRVGSKCLAGPIWGSPADPVEALKRLLNLKPKDGGLIRDLLKPRGNRRVTHSFSHHW